MNRIVSPAVALVALGIAGSAGAHPGHATPHLLHEADALLGLWWLAGACAAAVGYALAKRRS